MSEPTEVTLIGELLKTGPTLAAVLLVGYFFVVRFFKMLDELRAENSRMLNSYLEEGRREREAHSKETSELAKSVDRLCDAQTAAWHELRELRRDVRQEEISDDIPRDKT